MAMDLKRLSENDRNELAQELDNKIQGVVRHEVTSRMLYATDASVYQVTPCFVVIPRTIEDVVETVKFAVSHGISVIPRGGGTSLEGQTVGEGIQIDFAPYLNQLVSVNVQEKTAIVQPGMVLGILNQKLAEYNLQFAPDVATVDRATIGGMVGNNSSGAHSVVYGKTVDHILALDAVCSDGNIHHFGNLDKEQLEQILKEDSFEASLYKKVVDIVTASSGEIVDKFPHILRRVSGYNLDELLHGLNKIGYNVPGWPGEHSPLVPKVNHFNLAKLLVGSEGTLAIATKIHLNLLPRPEKVSLLVSVFSDKIEALQANASLLQFQPSALEIMDRFLLELASKQADISRCMGFLKDLSPDIPGAMLVTEFSGPKEQVEFSLRKAKQFLENGKIGKKHLIITDPAVMANVWKVRKSGLPLLSGIPSVRKPVAFVEDTAVSPTKLVEYVKAFDKIMAKHGTEAACYAHASVGCLHLRPLLNLNDAKDVKLMNDISSDVTDLIKSLGGSLSGEHGDGKAHSYWLEKLFGSHIYQDFVKIKEAFDPENLFNPGDIVNAPVITENLRLNPKFKPNLPEPCLDWAKEGGWIAAINQCNGAGVCRKQNTGTMCPTYMATLDEEYSTRGRANALRAAMNGLTGDNFTSKRLFEILDRCVQCKGCKTECPSNVDMTRLKLEFQCQYYKEHPVSLRTRLFANAELTAKLGSAFAPLANWFAQSPFWPVLAKTIGVSPLRRLPHYASQTFDKWWKRRNIVSPSRHKVALFVDTWANFNCTSVGKSAVAVLEHCGFSVEPAKKVCCGRPALSKGLIDMVRKAAVDNLRLLKPYVEQGIPIVGLEPSCILTMRDEYPRLVPGAESEALAANCFTFEEFLADKNVSFTGKDERVLVHGHCHQKSLVGMAPMHTLLAKVSGLTVQEVDSGCCGMAGSFGYEVEHYELSQMIGKQRLFPAVEKAKNEGIPIIADGVSCRQQIMDATGVRALHVCEYLASLLPNGSSLLKED